MEGQLGNIYITGASSVLVGCILGATILSRFKPTYDLGDFRDDVISTGIITIAWPLFVSFTVYALMDNLVTGARWNYKFKVTRIVEHKQ